MATRPMLAARLGLLSLLAACSSEPSRNDTRVHVDPSQDGDAGDGSDKGDGTDGQSEDGASGDGDPGLDCTIPQAVYYGTTQPSAVLLTAGQIKSIGMFESGGGLCSGTLVTRDWVLTAKHCTEGASTSRMQFSLGDDPAQPDLSYAIVQKAEHPQRDTALIKLARSPLDDDPAIQPIRINDENLSSHMNEIFEGAGYGETERGRTGTRYFTAEPLVQLDDELASVDGEGRHGLCGGDSGGPLLGNFADGPRVVGGLYYGDESCVGVDSYTRTDTVADWIEGVIGPLSACGDVTAEGSCNGTTAVYCSGGSVKSDDCAAKGLACGLDAASSGYRCIEDVSCGDLTAAGRCEGSVAHWCEGDRPTEQNCAAQSLICGADDRGDARCIANPCDGVPAQGQCDGDRAVVCVGTSKIEVDCARCDQVCEVGASGVACVDG